MGLLTPRQTDLDASNTFNKHFSRPTVRQLDDSVVLMWHDILNVLSNLPLLPMVLSPFWTTTHTDELYLWEKPGATLIWWTIASLVQLPIMFGVMIGGIIAVTLVSIAKSLDDMIFWGPIQGQDLEVHPATLPPAGTYNSKHRWIFLNGIAVGGEGLHQNLQVLSERFHAPVLGIHNRTYGLLGDIGECILQRSFNYCRLDTRMAIPIIKKYLEQDPKEVEKIILVAHSQGGITASQVLERVYAQVSWDLIKDRLEVYTFGSAAAHFPNPFLDASKTERLVKHMEHYCHEKDMVCSFGALSSIKRLDNPYKGKVFIHKDEPGHMLNQHYLKGMFTGPESTWDGDTFQRGRLAPYPGVDGERWYVIPGDTAANQESVKDVSNLWRYMETRGGDVNGARH